MTVKHLWVVERGPGPEWKDPWGKSVGPTRSVVDRLTIAPTGGDVTLNNGYKEYDAPVYQAVHSLRATITEHEPSIQRVLESIDPPAELGALFAKPQTIDYWRTSLWVTVDGSDLYPDHEVYFSDDPRGERWIWTGPLPLPDSKFALVLPQEGE